MSRVEMGKLIHHFIKSLSLQFDPQKNYSPANHYSNPSTPVHHVHFSSATIQGK